MVTTESPGAVSRVRLVATGLSRLSSCQRWQVGSGLFLIFKIFNLPKFEIQISDLPDVQNSPNFA
jgi:hypothetical protein